MVIFILQSEVIFGDFLWVIFSSIILLALFISGGDKNLCFFSIHLVFYLKTIMNSVSFWKNHAFVVCEPIL